MHAKGEERERRESEENQNWGLIRCRIRITENIILGNEKNMKIKEKRMKKGKEEYERKGERRIFIESWFEAALE